MMLYGLMALVAALGQVDESRVREMVKQIDQSTETITFTSVEILKGDGKTLNDRYEYAFKRGGKSRLRMYRDTGDGEALVSHDRQDGRRGYRTNPFVGHPDSVNTLHVANQESTADLYSGPMSRALWAWMPGGRTVAAHLDAGATLTYVTDWRGGGEWVLETDHRGMKLRFALDPEHDWLPRWVDLEGNMRLEVTEYAHANGRWFPRSGESNDTSQASARFEITEFAINPPLSDSEFGMPEVPDGVMIVDATTGKTTYKGGDAARERLAETYPDPRKNEAPYTGDYLVVKRTDRPWLIPTIGACASLALLAFASYRYANSVR